MGILTTSIKTSYEVIAVNPEKFPDAHYVDTMTFIDFLTPPEVHEYIANFMD